MKSNSVFYTFQSIKALALSVIFILIFNYSFASKNDSIGFYGFKNTIRWNLTPMFVIGPKSIVLGYERVVGKHQSFSVNLGYLELSPMTDREGNPISFFDQNYRGGYDISADYRFYFKNRNKHIAPDGIYWGPYYSMVGLYQDATLNIMDNSVVKNQIQYNGQFNMYALGVQIGYQFVIKKRFVVDLMLMGPSYSLYSMKLGIKYDQQIDPNDPFYEDLWELLSQQKPLVANFLKKGSFDANGRLKFGYYGFRYGVQVGYRF